MAPILIGSLIELAGILLLMAGTMRHGFPPTAVWLVPAIVLILLGNAVIVRTILSKAIANKKREELTGK